MRTASFSTYVSGMTCRPCEDTILETLLAMRGILNADVSYLKASVQVTFDPEIVSEESIREKLVKIGYPPSDTASGGKKTELLTGAAVLLLFFLMPHLWHFCFWWDLLQVHIAFVCAAGSCSHRHPAQICALRIEHL